MIHTIKIFVRCQKFYIYGAQAVAYGAHCDIRRFVGKAPAALMLGLSVFDACLYFGKGVANVKVLIVSIVIAMAGCNLVM